MKVLVLAGGLSPERDVSLSSGCLIANALMECGYEVALTDVLDDVEPSDALFHTGMTAPYAYTIPEREPDLRALRQKHPGNALIGSGVLELCRLADVVFLGLHGGMGENGQLQATLDVHGIRYTGSSYEGCVLAMNKGLTKRLLNAEGIPTPRGVVITNGGIPANITYPCFVKPLCGGSSIGTSRADDEAALKKAISDARVYEQAVLVENMIHGREFSVGILDRRVLPPIEIIPRQGFYDYAGKYQAGLIREICPADLTAAQTSRAMELAQRIFNTLSLRDYARIDFILDDVSGDFVCLEANTLPGMTPTSLLPQEARAVGIEYREVCRRIVELALSR